MIFDIPFPPSILNPNRDAHWRKKYKAQQKYKRDCFYCVPQYDEPFESIAFVFHPPANRNYDKDNLIAALKYGQDAISSRIGIDDSVFNPQWHIGLKRPPHGLVRVYLNDLDKYYADILQ